ncbi:hypothetical protein DVK85_05295 [Flavobacterium arcticum]|uniref:Uncharacterized protein n=2 Tax=Flavobacterium arcticum TaxID=1784713 RepID=A0A345HAR6_9FLAO|nr:two-component regulator propeller domain-containing protein [Flavobacterium arcticum]AXG73676.1 hypothetical protein DVK85_05295 [Flavobacterium arcticum]KAF2511627.1 hypothetical protein E0W72_04805 [Flavobacterium arcticum]
MKKLFIVSLFIMYTGVKAQNLFPVKLENCNTEYFCLDCGDIKASYDEAKFEKMLKRLNKSLDLKDAKGGVMFQILIDTKGRGCTLSHTDMGKSYISKEIIKELNNFKGWKPAYNKDGIKDKVSINMRFTIQDNHITGKIERVDTDAFGKSFDRPVDPEIYNDHYTYTNENLKNYSFTIWNSSNSSLPDNSVNHIAADSKGNIWAIADSELLYLSGNEIQLAPENTTEEEIKKRKYFALGIDDNDRVWTDGVSAIFSLENDEWRKYKEDEIGIPDAYGFVNNPSSDEFFICSKTGLVIKTNEGFKMITKSKIKEFPSDRVDFAKRDSKNRLWIGTFDGSVMIDENSKATSFNDTKEMLKGYCITSMDEDDEGNLYFGLYELNPKDRKQANRNEGIAIFHNNGTWEHFTTKNSGMPFNHTTRVLFDKREKILWVSTDRAGLVRYDLNGNWENYHNLNSHIPTSYIADMCFDKEGNLYLATRQGIVKVEK